MRQRAPSPFDEDAAQATRRLFARTVAQVVEIHALERTFDAWRSLEARPKAPPSLPARPATNAALAAAAAWTYGVGWENPIGDAIADGDARLLEELWAVRYTVR